ncbi:hypothetical protein A2368_00615 [Candidatus Collierbacteria bacterium RIFOXYB1_FULL_49_13]|uniref:Cell division protein FtsX n=1 Tax=Candidatus Collierbacteria bacterium RIFOXYB1_FULL_49_13 TaxID=1817728 RepID=A0A1F5FHI1_9BACT|nr:MAG: hypothetical protein A2368_00615 [Candidatus Collierbacteria bacterium RIFOXYB1_FULL_49_13]
MRSIKEAGKNIRRTPYLSIAVVLVLIVNFFIAGIFSLLALMAQSTLVHFEGKPQIIAYLVDDATPEKIQPLINELRETGKIDQVKFVSKEDALNIYKQSVGDDPLLLGTITDLGLITADILPSSLEISAKSPDQFKDLVNLLKTSPLVAMSPNNQKDIDFPESAVSELTAWTKALRTAGITIIAVLGVTSALVMLVVTGMKVSHKKTEITTLKLLGAGGGFIAWPFILESTLLALFSSFIAWLLTYSAMLYSSEFLAPRLSGIYTLPIPLSEMLLILGVQEAAALVLGLISGWLAIYRFARR